MGQRLNNTHAVGGPVWKANRNELVCLIRKVGQMWREPAESLEEYVVDQVSLWSDSMERLNQAIQCFKQLAAAGGPDGKAKK
jgi:hypothetical protein